MPKRLRSSLVEVVNHQHGVMVVGEGRGVEQRRQQIGPGVPDVGGVLLDAVQHLFDVGGCELRKPLPHKGGGILGVPPDLDGGAGRWCYSPSPPAERA